MIWIGEAGFEAWISDGKLSRLRLPELHLLPPDPALEEGDPPVTIDAPGEAGPGEEECLETLASFLLAVVTGREPASRPAVDLGGVGEFTRRALEHVSLLGRGETASYARVAAMAGRPGAARAAGRAMACNPVPLVIPCHRVVRSDGNAGGWSGPPGWKRWLLDRELRPGRGRPGAGHVAGSRS